MSMLPPVPPNTDYQAQSATQSSGLQNRGLDLSQQSLGIQQGALQRQQELAPKEYNLQNQIAGVDTQQLQRQQDYYTPAAATLANEGFAIQGGQLLNQYKEGWRQSSGNAAATGTTNAGWGHQWDQFLNNWATKSAGLDISMGQSNLGFQQQQEGIGNQLTKGSFSDQLRALAEGEREASLRDSGSELGIQGSRIGLEREQVGLGLQDTISGLGQQDLVYQSLRNAYLGGQ